MNPTGPPLLNHALEHPTRKPLNMAQYCSYGHKCVILIVIKKHSYPKYSQHTNNMVSNIWDTEICWNNCPKIWVAKQFAKFSFLQICVKWHDQTIWLTTFSLSKKRKQRPTSTENADFWYPKYHICVQVCSVPLSDNGPIMGMPALMPCSWHSQFCFPKRRFRHCVVVRCINECVFLLPRQAC